MPLQFLPPAQRVTLWARGPDSGDAGGIGAQEAVVQGHLRRPPGWLSLCSCWMAAQGVSRKARRIQMRRLVTADGGSTVSLGAGPVAEGFEGELAVEFAVLEVDLLEAGLHGLRVEVF